MSKDKKPNSGSGNGQKGNVSEGLGKNHQGVIIKGHIPDFKHTSPPPDRPNTTNSTDTSSTK